MSAMRVPAIVTVGRAALRPAASLRFSRRGGAGADGRCGRCGRGARRRRDGGRGGRPQAGRRAPGAPNTAPPHSDPSLSAGLWRTAGDESHARGGGRRQAGAPYLPNLPSPGQRLAALLELLAG